MQPNNLMRRRGFRASIAASAALALGLGVAACGSSDSSSSDGTSSSGSVSGNVNLVAYSTPQEVYEKVLEPGFQAGDGADVEFSNSFGASGDQSRAVEAGQPADLVHFALEPDMTRLVDAGLVDSETGRTTSTTASSRSPSWPSPSARATRRTSRTGTTSLRDDVEVITPNPFTSGGARWNIMAAYGAQIEPGQVRGRGAAVRRRHARQHRRAGRERIGRAGDVHLR